ncbi:MAG: phosphate/phosphite/phosphonate ABC transporter substrate-binding protein [Rhodospirillales bacterium]
MRKLFTTMLAVALTAAVSATAVAKDYKIAVTDIQGMDALISEWGPFKEALEKATGHSFEFFPVTSQTATAEALRSKKLDFAITGPAEYVAINKLTNAEAMIGLARPDYYCGIVVKNADGINRVSDLKGKAVSFANPGSTSGHFCPMQVLRDHGIDPMKDIKVVHTKKNLQHTGLVRGDTAGIGVKISSWIKYDRSKEANGNGDFKVLARSGDLPYDMLMGAGHLTAAERDEIKNAIVANEAMMVAGILAGLDDKGKVANDKYEGTRLLPVNDSDYDMVRDMYITAGLPEFGIQD